jgi:hypothetical protein
MSLYDEFDKNLYKIGQNVTVQESDQLQGGSIVNSLVVSSGSLRSGSFDDGISGWQISDNGDAQFNNLTLTGGVLKSGKTSFTDSTNAGYYISNAGVYVGSALDATKLKYTVADGTLDLVGTISSRSTATIAGAIDSVGDLITTKLNTSTKRILSDFNFGTTDYAGAVKAGDIAWNTSTGAITSGSGVVVYRNGIVGASSGTPTFSIDATTGNATFAGTLSGASGTFGTITAGTIDGCDVYANNFRYKKNTFQYLLGCTDGWSTSISAGGTLTHYASNQMSLSLASALDETSYIQTVSEAILIGSATTQAVRWDYNPSMEFWAKITNVSQDPTIDVRMGPVNVDNVPFFGWQFVDDITNGRVITSYYDSSLHNGAYISGINADQWHRYRIQVTKTGADAYTVKWYIDDVERESHDVAVAIANPSFSLGIKLKNNATDIAKTANIAIAHAQFQQKYA